MEEWPTLLTERDFNGVLFTWDLEVHATDADWETYKEEKRRRLPFTKPEITEKRYVDVAECKPIDCPDTDLSYIFFINKFCCGPHKDSFVRAVLEVDYLDLDREPRIYCKENHWGVCFVFKNEQGQEYLSIPQGNAVKTAGMFRNDAHVGYLGICPGLRKDLVVVIGEAIRQDVMEYTIRRIKEERKEISYKEEVIKKAQSESLAEDPEILFKGPPENPFYKSLVYEAKVDTLRRVHSNKILRKGLKGHPLLKSAFLDFSEKIHESSLNPRSLVRQMVPKGYFPSFKKGAPIPPSYIKACVVDIPPRRPLIDEEDLNREAKKWIKDVFSKMEDLAELQEEVRALCNSGEKYSPKLRKDLNKARTKIERKVKDGIPPDVLFREELVEAIVNKLAPETEDLPDSDDPDEDQLLTFYYDISPFPDKDHEEEDHIDPE